MILSDTEIERRLDRGQLRIGPLEDPELQVQPASVDLRLSNDVQVATGVGDDNPLVRDELSFEAMTVGQDEEFVIHPGEFWLASTIETVEVPPTLVGHVTGRSSIGRQGLLIHVSAGLCDPGWEGQITLELVNLSPAPVRLEPGDRVCQLYLVEVKGTVDRAYGERSDSRYQGQRGPVASRDV